MHFGRVFSVYAEGKIRLNIKKMQFPLINGTAFFVMIILFSQSIT